MKKLKALAETAAEFEAKITTPAHDANVWRQMMIVIAHGLLELYPGQPNKQNAEGLVFMRALEDGLTDRAKRALMMAQRLQQSMNKIENQGGEG